ncbi:NAD-dependent deacylase [Amaricoccus solimangrovi]|uniref:NAD-dependent protein deacylase n=1 Tax=Amaricoccus solimangrovi TaxID=2589815 RepID=A0A501WPT4_9RHOB|nr:NAD-dependent deacylase [Amaricoccus solimangrovi]TPE51348.1 NAD-dependent deacylase [Amaricoccus solimangrovi]
MRVFVLTGAGISAGSGLGTFRDAGGIWARFDPVKLATPAAFAADPGRVHDFYNTRRRAMLAAGPNAAHFALAELGEGLRTDGGALFLCTQNIDDLHERAGSRAVHHMHGRICRALCGACRVTVEWRGDLGVGDHCAACGRSGTLRPDVVWFGEMPYDMPEIEAALARADLFVAIGTSGAVYPAAEFVEIARTMGILTLEFNLEKSANAHLFDESVYGPAVESVPRFVARLLGTGDAGA